MPGADQVARASPEGRAVIPYRADIDGLRAVAVLAVIVFHLNRAWLPGGYVGVDIFFVISGFLITRIISREMAAGRFSFRWFYVKRMRRILPVFYTVTTCTVAVGSVLLLPKDMRQLMDSARHAIFFIANLYFGKSQGYFDIAADEKPLLHTWSLAIEEQYYLFWPLLLMVLVWGCHWLLRNRTDGEQRTWIQVAGLTLLLAVAGYAYAQWALVRHPGAQQYYFQIQTRFSELMTGSFIALVPLWSAPRALRAFAYLGALLIVASLALLTERSIFPGVNALLPCAGAALIIYACQSTAVVRSTWLHRALGFKVMATIGLWSYSLYLWHWPILAYMRYVYGSYLLPWTWMAAAVALTFALSWLSYEFIERRTRRMTPRFRTAAAAIFLAPALLLSGASWAAQALRPVVAAAPDLATYGTDVCHGNFTMQCVRGDRLRAPTVLMTGDSHAAMLNSFIDVVGRHEGWSAQVVTASSCSPVFGYDEKVLPDWAQAPCVALKNYVARNYRQYDAVFIASFWAYQLGMDIPGFDPDYLAELKATVAAIARTTPVYVFADDPHLAIDPFRAAHFHAIGLKVRRAAPELSERANAIVRRAVERIPNAHWVDLSREYARFGSEGLYRGVPAYLDTQHLNEYGAKALGALFNQQRQLLLPSEPGGAARHTAVAH